jgi:hypothetical protein
VNFSGAMGEWRQQGRKMVVLSKTGVGWARETGQLDNG